MVSPDQKENLFATLAELFDHSCSTFEMALNELKQKVRLVSVGC